MQVNKTEEEPDFKPYTLEITIESKEEEEFFRWLKYANSTIPSAIHNTIMGDGVFDRDSLENIYRNHLLPAIGNILD